MKEALDTALRIIFLVLLSVVGVYLLSLFALYIYHIWDDIEEIKYILSKAGLLILGGLVYFALRGLITRRNK